MEGSVLQQKPKTVLKSVNKTEQLVGMSKSKREKNQNKNHPNRVVACILVHSSLCLGESESESRSRIWLFKAII